jgi:hypothetical protein
MLSIFDTTNDRNCERVTRRELLRVGTLGFCGLSLAELFAQKSQAASNQIVRNKSVVFLFLGGGPPQHETFDPKMEAPTAYRAMFGDVQTKIPGVSFGSTFGRLAGLADRMTVVRSYQHGMASHGSATATVIAGRNPTEAMLGTVYARVAGSTNPNSGLPNNIMLGPAAAGADFRGNPDYTKRCAPVGSLSPSLKPFDPSGKGDLKQNMELQISKDRLDDRRHLLTALDDLKRNNEAISQFGSVDRFNQQAFDVLLGGATKAFDLAEEDPRTIARYDTGHIRIPKRVLQKKKKKGFAEQTPQYLGKQMLLARRMVEAGCGFVTVTSTGWDLHGNRFGVDDGMPVLGAAVDHAVSAFVEDLEQRGLTDDVLLVITGEFGRTPKINDKAGRDHWGRLSPLALFGGGLPMGQVIGQSDRTGGEPASDPVTLENVAATLLGTLFDVGQLRLRSEVPVELNRFLADHEPIPGLSPG